MAYMINIRHTLANNVSLPVTLTYDDATSSNSNNIDIDLTNQFQNVELTGWTNVDASKIKVIEKTLDEGDVRYHILNQYASFTNQS